MLLYVVRHGKAERESQSGRDQDRPLMSLGRKQVEFLARQMIRGEHPWREPPACIISSPAVRAADTARIIAAAIDINVTFDDSLRVDNPLPTVLSMLRSRLGSAPILVAGHNPQLEDLVDKLAPGDPYASGPLRTGELVTLDLIIEPKGLTGRVMGRARLDEEL